MGPALRSPWPWAQCTYTPRPSFRCPNAHCTPCSICSTLGAYVSHLPTNQPSIHSLRIATSTNATLGQHTCSPALQHPACFEALFQWLPSTDATLGQLHAPRPYPIRQVFKLRTAIESKTKEASSATHVGMLRYGSERYLVRSGSSQVRSTIAPASAGRACLRPTQAPRYLHERTHCPSATMSLFRADVLAALL